MAEENVLKIELAKLQAQIQQTQAELSDLTRKKEKAPFLAETEKRNATVRARDIFERKRADDCVLITELCKKKRNEVEELLDSFPDLATQEFAGKYEVQAIEQQLQTLYPTSLLENYVPSRPIQFETEGDAYNAYLSAERGISKLKHDSFATSMFNSITSLLHKACRDDGAAGKVSWCALSLFVLSFVVSPYFFLIAFSAIGVCAMVHGAAVNRLLCKLYSVKVYLNNIYDEDIFQKDRSNILAQVDAFLEEVEQEALDTIASREFVMDQSVLRKIEEDAKKEEQHLTATIAVTQQRLNAMQTESAMKLAELDRIIEHREKFAEEHRVKTLELVDWKHEWLDTILTDVTSDKRVQTCSWTRSNTVYFSKSEQQLQCFQKLASYQSLLHMHPTFASQVIFDYKNMAIKVAQFGRLPAAIMEVLTTAEDINKRCEKIAVDIRARFTNILQSSESLEAFNDLMKTYDSPGESYTIFHIMGLDSINSNWRMFMKNGPRVGMYFKFYFTHAELVDISKDFPFEDITEFAEVGDTVTPRTLVQVRRIFDEGT